jgi:hypothetical protein
MDKETKKIIKNLEKFFDLAGIPTSRGKIKRQLFLKAGLLRTKKFKKGELKNARYEN